ncbi:arylamine N-acetyltransferase family protein [Streptomyces indicus]|uniref:N-hydroxyarylamine O-acetyltransferase n=1 Tax=Streptomyces indicus TaxID=417292 RepID=A0A1G9IZ86_9ACTN|nr:arylamine N-acetyltransferase [Streptomyces indicus]SDL30577.1 N-hydroxyarylamine O-acetyltransferase [Streptomyces indicus]
MSEQQAASVWQGEDLDLEAYLERIGFEGPRDATLDTLGRLQRAHTTSIPFENVHAVLGTPLPIDLDSVQERLVRRRRGGYCFEHVVLFAAALERLGFDLTGISGRITLGAAKITPATHAMIVVRFPEDDADDDRAWLCDVGFGSGPTAPIELADGAMLEADGWRYRLLRGPGALTDTWSLQQDGPDGWTDRNTFVLVQQYPIDYRVGSHYVGTHPRSPFVTRLFAQRFTGTHHHQLDGTLWKTFTPDGTHVEKEVDPADLGRLLAETFDIRLEEGELAAILGQSEPQ